ncbi:MAG: hypothetical protein H0W50_08545 [Parachlamydiaceae bacterium]|nr:hypothetical protein [Parachlamydiaceae bacterium]
MCTFTNCLYPAMGQTHSNANNELYYAIDGLTTPKKFEKLCERYPGYNLEKTCATDDLTLFESHCVSALHDAIMYGNFELTSHIIKKFGKRLIDIQDSNKRSPLFTALEILITLEERNQFFNKNNSNNHQKIFHKLISSGADVNNCILYDNLPVSMLDTAAKFRPNLNKDTSIKISKLLLQYGAQDRIAYFTQVGISILENAHKKDETRLKSFIIATKFKIFLSFLKEKLSTNSINNEKLQIYIDKFHFPTEWKGLSFEDARDVMSTIIEKNYDDNSIVRDAKLQIYNEKFQFFSGLRDEKSIVNSLPKEIVATILKFEQSVYPNISEKAHKMINQALKICSENEVLFLCGQIDQYSQISLLPQEIIAFILEMRIAAEF